MYSSTFLPFSLAPRELIEHELRIGDEVPLEQPSGLLDEAVQPLEAEVLHPDGRLRSDPSEDVEGPADPDHEAVYAPAHPVTKLFLSWSPQRHPDEIGVGAIDAPRELGFLLLSHLSEHRGLRSADDQTGVVSL